MFCDKLLLIIDPDLLIRCFNCYFLSYVARRDAVEGAIVLDMEISPNGSFFLVIRLILQYRKRQKSLLFFLFEDRCTGSEFLGVILAVPGDQLPTHDVVVFLQGIDIQTLHRADDIVLHNAYVPLYMAFVAGLFDPRRSGSCSIVGKELDIPGIQNALFIKVLPVNSCRTVVWNDKCRNASIKSESIRMAGIPGGHLFIQKTFTVKVPAVRECHDEYMHLDQFSSIAVKEMTFITGPVGLCLQSGNMVHRKADVMFAAIIGDDLVEATQLIGFLSADTCIGTVFCPKLIAKISFTLLLQDRFTVRLKIVQVHTFPRAEQNICELFIGEIGRDAINAAPHVFATGYDPLDRIPLAAKAVRYSCIVQAESFQPDDGFVV